MTCETIPESSKTRRQDARPAGWMLRLFGSILCGTLVGAGLGDEQAWLMLTVLAIGVIGTVWSIHLRDRLAGEVVAAFYIPMLITLPVWAQTRTSTLFEPSITVLLLVAGTGAIVTSIVMDVRAKSEAAGSKVSGPAPGDDRTERAGTVFPRR